MAQNSIMIDLDDPRSSKIAEAMSSKTSKKILGALAEKEMSESDIAAALKLPLTTIGYNVKKLVAAGLVEETKRLFWSTKGRRIKLYKVSNKRIVISPKKMIKGVIPAALITGALALLIRGMSTRTPRINELSEPSSPAIPMRGTEIEKTTDLISKTTSSEFSDVTEPMISETASNGENLLEVVLTLFGNTPDAWAWYFLGALSALLIYLLWNLEKQQS